MYLSWGEPPPAIGTHFARADAFAADRNRLLRHGVRMHVIARPEASQAWAAAAALLADADPDAIAVVQKTFKTAASEGHRRMTALLTERREDLEIYPNIWAGVGLLRGAAGTTLVGSYVDVADRIAEYQRAGVDEFILSGYPHVEEALWFSEGVMPILRERGLLPGGQYV